LFLARRSCCPIVPFHLYAEHAHIFEKAWDRFQLPRPFSRVVLVIGSPIEVPDQTGREVIERKQAELQTSLQRTRATAESWFAMPEAERERQRAVWDN
jgi:lysophospholipid acyltransferase (LPLAT)-like uncharacterized protein